MNIENPKDLADALGPVVQSAVQTFVAGLGPISTDAVQYLTAGLATSVDAAIEGSLRRILDGATVTVTINLKPIPK